MKKTTAILLAILYTAITSGFTVNVHYCMGKLASVKLLSPATKECGKCGKTDQSNSCCKDELKFCKVAVSHQAAKAQQPLAPQAMDLSLPLATLIAPSIHSVTSFTAYYHHAPPEKASIPLYKRYGVFLI